ncbi:MAG: 4-hydroxy-3-methylbut-2-enyl diphosphate reductase [Bdellovibrionales bacterium]|nr:4-hydroxy-3-methylbut-2-enyl diphosphate reductase [Bdellovibrionales bacterium]
MTKLLLATPRGFCAGVVRAIDIVDLAIKHYGTPLYVRKEIVHNQSVVEKFRSKGVVFVETLDEVPSDQLVIFSAHGVSPEVRKRADERNLKVIDATCPLVTKVHSEVHKYKKLGFSIALIGHADHDEVEGTLGEAPEVTYLVETVEDVAKLEVPDPSKIVALTQTTLSVDECKEMIQALRNKFPLLTTPSKDDICYATQNRQDAVKAMAKAGLDLLLVVGSQNSSNSKRLCEVAHTFGIEAYLIDAAQEIQESWIENKKCIGLTAGASAPEYLVQSVVEFLTARGAVSEEFHFIEEDVSFSLPPELIQFEKQSQKPLPQARKNT